MVEACFLINFVLATVGGCKDGGGGVKHKYILHRDALQPIEVNPSSGLQINRSVADQLSLGCLLCANPSSHRLSHCLKPLSLSLKYHCSLPVTLPGIILLETV